jgi:hypothetical protein
VPPSAPPKVTGKDGKSYPAPNTQNGAATNPPTATSQNGAATDQTDKAKADKAKAAKAARRAKKQLAEDIRAILTSHSTVLHTLGPGGGYFDEAYCVGDDLLKYKTQQGEAFPGWLSEISKGKITEAQAAFYMQMAAIHNEHHNKKTAEIEDRGAYDKLGRTKLAPLEAALLLQVIPTEVRDELVKIINKERSL